MPVDQYDDEDETKAEMSSTAGKYKDFDCPSCNANNPCDPPFGDGDELLCNYCGTEYRVKVTDEGKARLREM